MKRLVVLLLAFLVLVNVSMASEYIEREFILPPHGEKNISIDINEGETLHYDFEVTSPEDICIDVREELPDGGQVFNPCVYGIGGLYEKAYKTSQFKFTFSNIEDEDVSVYFKYKVFPEGEAPEEPEPAPTPCAPIGFLLLVPLIAIWFRKG